MTKVIPGAAPSASLTRLAGLDRFERYGAVGKASCAAISRRLQHRGETWLRQLEEIALEFLAAIVVIVIFVMLTEHSRGENL